MAQSDSEPDTLLFSTTRQVGVLSVALARLKTPGLQGWNHDSRRNDTIARSVGR